MWNTIETRFFFLEWIKILLLRPFRDGTCTIAQCWTCNNEQLHMMYSVERMRTVNTNRIRTNTRIPQYSILDKRRKTVSLSLEKRTIVWRVLHTKIETNRRKYGLNAWRMKVEPLRQRKGEIERGGERNAKTWSEKFRELEEKARSPAVHVSKTKRIFYQE